MGSSLPLTVALPSFFFWSVLLAASLVASARAEESDNATQRGQPANDPALSPNTPLGSAQPVATAMAGNTTLSASQPTTQTNTSPAPANPTNALISLQKVDGQFLLEARQTPLAGVLRQIADKTGAVIHYSVLPEEPVTATCAGGTVKAVMECLLGNWVDRIYRQTAHTKTVQSSSLQAQAHSQATEIWLMGSRFGHLSSTMQCTLDGNKVVPNQNAKNEASPEQAPLRMAQASSDPRFAELRKQAIALLATQGKTGDPAMDDEVTDTLQQALKDQDPEIRAQAVFGMMNQDSTNTEILHEALQDNNPDVRLMAVDSADANNPAAQALLQGALSDGDETVKAAASAKLGME